ncbi:hypothetical protein EYF80_067911 [Liparis tanakae]|uniref:Uncharacterized protein n=1 Tax=Liparis tanakae TaxID=230148 RepID=A0A4Z2DZV3_9TELE|nr:hypothetical protein EYF80_067911 [Liparis tanakae]
MNSRYNWKNGGNEREVLQGAVASTSAPLVAPVLPPRGVPQGLILDQTVAGGSQTLVPPAAAPPTTEADAPAAGPHLPTVEASGPPPPPPPPALPKTTVWKRKQLEQRRQEAERKGVVSKINAAFSCTCSLCKQPKTKAFGHSCFHSSKLKTMFHFCQTSSGGQSVMDWLQREEAER